MPVVIRKVQSSSDWFSIRRICCRTAGAGATPIDAIRWPFFGELWVGPYEKLLPAWAWVAEDSSLPSPVIGYLTGCPDTLDFEKRKLLGFTLPLLIRVLARGFALNGDARRFLKRTLRLDRSPEESFPKEVLARLRSEYPAHLHTNLEGSHRGQGVGRDLSEAFFAELRKAGVPGVHVFCGADPIAFYEKTGFKVVAKIEFRPGVQVFAMGKRL